MNDLLELDFSIEKKKPIMHEDCLDCGKKFTPLPYDVHGAVGGFFCVSCIEEQDKNGRNNLIIGDTFNG